MTLFDSPTKSVAVLRLQQKMMEGMGEGWKDVFRGADDILYNICDQLYKMSGSEVFCPGSSDVFRAFRECKYSALRVVFILQDPYHQVINSTRVADGIAMSCRNTGILQPSLKLVYDEIERTVGNVHRNPDLVCWANQGILMLNTALTVAQGKPGSHTEIWRPFTQYILREIGKLNNIIYVFAGAHAKSFSNFVSGTKFLVSHPASAAYRGGHWDSGDVFNKVNNELNEKIVW